MNASMFLTLHIYTTGLAQLLSLFPAPVLGTLLQCKKLWMAGAVVETSLDVGSMLIPLLEGMLHLMVLRVGISECGKGRDG